MLWLLLFLITVGSTIVMGVVFREYTNASLPFLDSFLTSVSLVAQWMIARKKIENWLLWIFADVIYIPLYIYKELPLTAFLYLVFLVMAIKGFIDWKKASTQPVH
jgi:nicotinamide mononucleotide transporter